MHRIDSAGNVNSLFVEGNPQAGQRATAVSADWLNDVQENLVAILEQAGVVPAKGEPAQLYDSIVAIIASAFEGYAPPAAGGGGLEAGAYVPAVRQITTAGLASGGGTLANNLTINVPAATVAEILAGTVNNKAVTPANLYAAITSLLGGIGYIRLHGGLIFQWGIWRVLRWTTRGINLPIAFPNNCVWASSNAAVDDTDAGGLIPAITGRGTTLISVKNGRSEDVDVNYLAIGY